MREKERRAGMAALFWWLLAAGWIYVLFYLARQTAADSAALSSRIARGLLRRLPFLRVDLQAFELFLRKIAHFGIFAVEGFLLRIALFATKPRGFFTTFLALFLCMPLAAANEMAQLTAFGRVCSVADMAIDMAGALLGILVAALACWIWGSAVIRFRYKRLTEK